MSYGKPTKVDSYMVRSGRSWSNQVLLHHKGRTMRLSEWAQESGVPYRELFQRIHKEGWVIAEALSTPGTVAGSHHGIARALAETRARNEAQRKAK